MNADSVLFAISCIGCVVGVVGMLIQGRNLRISQENAQRQAEKHAADMRAIEENRQKETEAQIEARVRRDTHLERDCRETAQTTRRIEESLGGMNGKLDTMNEAISKLDKRLTAVETHQEHADGEIKQLRSIAKSDADMYVKDHETMGHQ